MTNLFTSKKSTNFNSNIPLSSGGIFTSNNNNQITDIFANIDNININQEDDEHCCEVINDEKTELSQIKEAENESQSGTESAFKSRKNSQLNLNSLRDNYNLNEDKKDDEFLKPLDVNLNNNKNEQNNIFNMINNNNSINSINNININNINSINNINNKNININNTNNNINSININSINNNINQWDFEDEVNKQYGLFPII